MYGLDGVDTMYGHSGNDMPMSGDLGNDRMYGGGDSDEMRGVDGEEILWSGLLRMAHFLSHQPRNTHLGRHRGTS
jgi:Ca2+-binding RTX toxin-like protein